MVAVKYWYRYGIRLTLAVIWWLGVSLAAHADDAIQALEQRLADLDGVTATFEQQIVDSQDVLVESATGQLWLSKPRFRWEVTTPFPQIIVADGDNVLIYDPDLEQVTERAVGRSLTEAPLALLTETKLKLAQHFRVVALQREGTRQRYRLFPLAADALFASFDIEFDDKALTGLFIKDHTNRQTDIRLRDYAAGQVLQSEVFQLDLPAGVDRVRG